MRKDWTRREFLGAGVSGSMVLRRDPGASFVPITYPPLQAKQRASGLSARQRNVLRAAADEIIPSADGMPAASEAGVMEYLDALVGSMPQLKGLLQKALDQLERISRRSFQKDFSSLERGQRVEALEELERRASPDLFATLRDYVYEGYYLRPKVWGLLGYQFYPTHGSGPRMKPFDEGVLAQVRKMPKLYREVK